MSVLILEDNELCERFSKDAKMRVDPYLMRSVEKDLKKIYL